MHVHDLFEGRVFASIDDGMAYVNELGFEEMIARGARVASELPCDMIYAGFSLGVLSAQKLAQTREGARGALLFYSCVPTSMFGSPWPAELPVQIHGMDADPYFVEEGDLEAAQELVSSANHADLYVYPGNQHYFADSSLSSYDADATALLLQRVLKFLSNSDDVDEVAATNQKNSPK
ncbi:dienelactone hydrolase [Paenibacillus qinlingensis]|uniref:Dienelactone hydrolase n=1 Tax=Paenibacillus qinlingensis TaxID=1837343 RepID=A0ABU1NZ65_9BACL|nr:dienelactone hydrolase [Paenibacillus qinlingensis]